jgi:hypothetical protein
MCPHLVRSSPTVPGGGVLRGARGEACLTVAPGQPRLGLSHSVLKTCPSLWSRGDSNPGPPPCKGGALPAKLRPRRSRSPAVGAPGLEPGTSALSGPRSNQLSYAPIGHGWFTSTDRCGPVPNTKQDDDIPPDPPASPRRSERPCRAANVAVHRAPRLGPPLAASSIRA